MVQLQWYVQTAYGHFFLLRASVCAVLVNVKLTGDDDSTANTPYHIVQHCLCYTYAYCVWVCVCVCVCVWRDGEGRMLDLEVHGDPGMYKQEGMRKYWRIWSLGGIEGA